ncbi:MAG: glycogen debranching enzyme, partial [Hyphomonas sp.]|nr:glycogen debranching enzyme [Hyphomonas sp.]
NNDGHDHNLSDNMGAEGETEDEAILQARLRRAKAMLATVLLSQGVPMILAGDEFGNSQGGNNNAYCQDNEISWLDWSKARPELIEAVSVLSKLRRETGLSRARFGVAQNDGPDDNPVLAWLHPQGRAMEDADWRDAELRCFGLKIVSARDPELLIVLNAGDDCQFQLPNGEWTRRLDTTGDDLKGTTVAAGSVTVPWQGGLVFGR